jgi:hypothetical protein
VGLADNHAVRAKEYDEGRVEKQGSSEPFKLFLLNSETYGQIALPPPKIIPEVSPNQGIPAPTLLLLFQPQIIANSGPER